MTTTVAGNGLIRIYNDVTTLTGHTIAAYDQLAILVELRQALVLVMVAGSDAGRLGIHPVAVGVQSQLDRSAFAAAPFLPHC